ncbi:MAG: hypothetical protein LBT40_08995 [Deltaproteobacteria bacterium]|jgi:hypothetical protein|nr:hypothetical protein [Deltaproteobacteria bacterium]
MTSGDTGTITRAEAEAALRDPEKGSLAVLKAVGKFRDQYSRELQTGVRALKAKNPFEEVCAEAALNDYLEDLRSEGMDVPDDLAVVKAGTRPPSPAAGGTESITRAEAEAALKDPEKGSLAVLKAVGRLRDQYSRELQAGARALKTKNPFEEVCAEAALKDYLEDLKSEGMDVPDDVTVVRTGT